jgi:hypothetical protein
MNVVLDIADVNRRNLYYCEPVTNTVMDFSVFVKTGYTDELIIMNGIYINCPFDISKVDKYYHNYKYKYGFDYNKNMDLIDGLIKIERMIIECHNMHNLIPVYKLRDQLLSLHIKVFENVECSTNTLEPGDYNFTLKISGIWQNGASYGLTFKFFSQETHSTVC